MCSYSALIASCQRDVANTGEGGSVLSLGLMIGGAVLSVDEVSPLSLDPA